MSCKIKLLILPAFICGIICLYQGSSAAQLYDRIVAVVNDESITSSELARRANPLLMRMISPNPPTPEKKGYKKKVLLDLIDRRLMAQKAKETGIGADKGDIDRYINNMVSESGKGLDDFMATLKEGGIDFKDYRRGIAENIAHSRLLHFEVRSRIVVTDEEALVYYNEHYRKTEDMPKGYHLMQIGLSWNRPGSLAKTREEAARRAGELRTKIEKGANFKEMAHRFSELPSAAGGGDLSFLLPSEMAPWMREIIKDKKPGELTEVAEGAGAMQFFLIFARNVAGKPEPPPFPLVKDDIKRRLITIREEKTRREWLTKLKKEAYIRIMM